MIRRRYYPTLKRTRRPTFRQQVGMSLQRNPIKNYEHTERPTTDDDIKRALRLVKKSNLYPRLGFYHLTAEISPTTQFSFNLNPNFIISKLNEARVRFDNFIVPSVNLIKEEDTDNNPLSLRYTLHFRGGSFLVTTAYNSQSTVRSTSFVIGGFYVSDGKLFGPDWRLNASTAYESWHAEIGSVVSEEGPVQCVYNEEGSSLQIEGLSQDKLLLLVNVILMTF